MTDWAEAERGGFRSVAAYAARPSSTACQRQPNSCQVADLNPDGGLDHHADTAPDHHVALRGIAA
jgi:hypothetical protein